MPDQVREFTRRTFVVASVATVGLLAGCTKQEPAPAPSEDKPAPEQPDAQTPEQPVEQDKVYIVDTFKPKPGDAKAFMDDYLKRYTPLAEGGGMTFVDATIAPPIWLDDDSNTVRFVWTIPDLAQAAWAMSSATRYNPDYVAWWDEVRKRVVSRDRSYYASEQYMEVLNNV